MPTLTVRYYAAARAAAGTSSELIDASCVDEALAALCARHDDDRFARVVEISSLLLDGLHVDDGQLRLGCAAELDILPPFAGG